MINRDFCTPAKVKYIGKQVEDLIPGHIYEAFLIEYWEGTRNSLHVRDESGHITDFHPLEDFEILEDLDNVLNNYEASLRCITHRFDNDIYGITFGKKYRAIGMDRNGLYLVRDNTGDCYFYSSDDFEIISDEHGILKKVSLYYSFK